jgi:translation initiation factor 1|tara:strand:+ start:105 stop:467 length:363 start_codon:yes stop_codon:yes gene_type:complete
MKTPKRGASDGNTVYSTDRGRICTGCQRPVAGCVCRDKPASTGDGVVRVSRETKGRKGKGVTVVTGVPAYELERVGKALRKRCGTGGTVKDGHIEIQGEQRELVATQLQASGYTVKVAGG